MRRSARAERKGVLSRQSVTKPRATPPREGIGCDLLGVLGFAFSVAIFLALVSFDVSRPTANLVGPAGHRVATRLLGTLGVCAYLAPALLLYVAVALFVRAPARHRGRQVLAVVVFAIFCSAVAHLVVGREFTSYLPGGTVGAALGEALRSGFSTAGSILVSAAIAACALIVATNAAVIRLVSFLGRSLLAAAAALGRLVRAGLAFGGAAIRAWFAERAREDAEAAAELEAEAEESDEPAEQDEDVSEPELDADEADAVAEEADRLASERAAAAERELAGAGEEQTEDAEPLRAANVGRQAPEKDPAWAEPEVVDVPLVAVVSDKPRVPTIAAPLASSPPEERPAAGKPMPPLPPLEAVVESAILSDEPDPLAEPQPALQAGAATSAPVEAVREAPEAPAGEAPGAATEPAQTASPLPRHDTPTIVEPKELPKPTLLPEKPKDPYALEGQSFSLPPLDLLDDNRSRRSAIDEAAFLATAQKLTAKLADFGINGSVVEIRPGPVVTMYEFAPGPGIKISKIASLADDLAMAMEALRVRIVAPIPGKGVVGIEVPNRERETVYFREILEQDSFQKSSSKLTMALGKDIEGMPYVQDLAKMPHLLIAGTTGSGKSVALTSMVMSLLYKSTAEDVRLLMVDPKRLELSLYEGIPHLLLPVVTDPRKAALALRWAVEEMERRYQILADVGVRNIASYNRLVDRGGSGPVVITPKRPKKMLVVDVAEGESEEEAMARAQAAQPPQAEQPPEEQPLPRRLPYIVIVIDELADLMMVASREVEMYLARLAQMARASGIHLVVATQRPSTDVVTGVIKANFPTRISFQLRSKPDSMTILGTPGAEALLGKGDMLILPPTSANLTRVHGAFVTENEIKAVVDHLRAQGTPVYDESILRPREDDEDALPEEDFSDELYDQAVRLVSEMRTVSISILQRRLRVGYQRSARMIERMEREGIVSPADGAKPREVLVRSAAEYLDSPGG